MAHVERSIFIEAAPEDVLGYAENPTNLPDWYDGVVEVHADYETPVGGGTFQQVYTAAGQRMEMTLTVTAYEPGQMIAFAMDGMITGTYRWQHIAENGGDHVTATLDYEMSGGLLGKIADKMVVERMNVTQMEKSLENLKAKLEG